MAVTTTHFACLHNPVEDTSCLPAKKRSLPLVAKAVIEAPLSHAISRGLAACVVGEDPLEIDRLWQRMYAGVIFFGRGGAAQQAISGVDMALWDIAGKAYGQPVYKLLGGGFKKKLRAYGSILFGDSPAQTYATARRLVDDGFTGAKFGWGPIGQSEAGDLAQIREARRGLGEQTELMIDAGLAYDTHTRATSGWSTASPQASSFSKPARVTSSSPAAMRSGVLAANWA